MNYNISPPAHLLPIENRPTQEFDLFNCEADGMVWQCHEITMQRLNRIWPTEAPSEEALFEPLTHAAENSVSTY